MAKRFLLRFSLFGFDRPLDRHGLRITSTCKVSTSECKYWIQEARYISASSSMSSMQLQYYHVGLITKGSTNVCFYLPLFFGASHQNLSFIWNPLRQENNAFVQSEDI